MKKEFEVIKIDNHQMTLKINPASTCSGCHANNTCGTGVLARYFNQSSVFHKPLISGTEVGDFVTLEIPSSTLFFHSFMLYIPPLLMLFLGGLMGVIFFPMNEFWQIGFGITGFCLSLLLIKFFGK